MMDEEDRIFKNKRERNERQQGQRGGEAPAQHLHCGFQGAQSALGAAEMRVVRARSPGTVLRRYRERASSVMEKNRVLSE